jgi:hypothetical protein
MTKAINPALKSLMNTFCNPKQFMSAARLCA